MSRYKTLSSKFDINGDVAANVAGIFEGMIEKSKPPTKLIIDRYIGASATSALMAALAIAPPPNLAQLYFWNAGIGDAGAASVCNALPSLPQCMKLEMLDCGITERGCAAIRALLSNRTGAHLRILRIDHNNIGDAGVAELATGMYYNQGLRELSLSFNNIGPAGGIAVANIMRGPVSELTTLSLEGNQLGDVGICDVAAACPRTKLTTLNLANNNFTEPRTCEAFARALAHNATLTTIDIDSNFIGDAGGEILLSGVCDSHHITTFLVTSFMSSNTFNAINAWVTSNKPEPKKKRRKKKDEKKRW
jgi:Ran GTPase-activating protein (RanGAP) involved in mRNA processing and transport